jgi:hypothetical protein
VKNYSESSTGTLRKHEGDIRKTKLRGQRGQAGGAPCHKQYHGHFMIIICMYSATGT